MILWCFTSLVQVDRDLYNAVEDMVDALHNEYNADFIDMDAEDRAAQLAEAGDALLVFFGRGGQLVESSL